MDLYLQYKLKSNNNYIKFLRENSYWYKYFNRSSSNFSLFEKEMKERYQLTFENKLSSFSDNLTRISELIDIFS